MPDLATSLSYCTFCPKLCRHTCPVSTAEARETVTPQTKMATMGHLRSGAIEKTTEAAAALYACTGCLACTTACHHGITPGVHLLEGRADAERDGIGHPALRELPARVEAHSRKAADEARAAVEPRRIMREGAVGFFPGCETPRSAATALRLFDRIGADHVGLASTTLGCGGYPLLAGGFPDAFRAHAERVARELDGFARVVVNCPACAWAMKKEYPARGVTLKAEVVNTVELLDTFVDRLPISNPSPKAAYYHDPCYLGRHQGLYDAPRRLLSRALGDGGLREFSRRREEAECSGGGGVLPITAPSTAAAIADARLEEVRQAGLDAVVTACPTCQRQLTRDGVTARDLVDVLEEATR